jgi:hypothetical protein
LGGDFEQYHQKNEKGTAPFWDSSSLLWWAVVDISTDQLALLAAVEGIIHKRAALFTNLTFVKGSPVGAQDSATTVS